MELREKEKTKDNSHSLQELKDKLSKEIANTSRKGLYHV
jgi:hypothetical protein